jgi:regulator of protease activity HflC (stomatin/prohibitin superfamily)
MSNVTTTRPPSLPRHYPPEKVREIGASYQLNLSGTVNTRVGSVIVFVAVAFFIYAIAYIILIPFSIILPGSLFLWALAAWLALMGFLLGNFFLVNVPKLTGVITTNLFTGELHVYGPGLHIRYPWERFTLDDYIDVRGLLVEHPSTFVTKDGIGLTFHWTMQYGVNLPLLALYVRTEEKVIDQWFVEVVEHAGQETIVKKEVEQVLHENTPDKILEGIEEQLQNDVDTFENTLEERFGIRVELVTVGPPDFAQEYKEALTAKALRNLITQDTKKMAEELHIPEEKALQMMMILNKEAVNQQIFTLQADEQIAKLAPVILAALQQLGRFSGRRGGSSTASHNPPTHS